VTDSTRIVVTVWTEKDFIFIPERYRIRFTFILRVFCWTGARIGAFFMDGFCYRDIKLVLQRTPKVAWKCIYKIDQRCLKNNRGPENIVFGTVLQEHHKFIYDDDDASFLLIMAFADKALFGSRKPDPTQCTKAGGVIDELMPRSAFSQIFQSTLLTASYLYAASVHSIRRQTGKKVDELNTEAQRSQHLTQADLRIFGQAYVANISSVEGQGTFLGEAINLKHIDYFQGFDRFREPGLPCELPARLEEMLKQEPKLPTNLRVPLVTSEDVCKGLALREVVDIPSVGMSLCGDSTERTTSLNLSYHYLSAILDIRKPSV
jgi:hypothetical protein